MSKSKPSRSESVAESTSSSRKTFFDLPAELRNTIYELVADCTLRLDPKPNEPSMIPGLLIASRRCRNEYTSILLATARIEASITDMNFERLILTLKGLDQASRKALISNKQLLIILRVRKCGSEVYANLRKWCEESQRIFQADDSAPHWNYVMEEKVPANAAQLDWYCGRVRVLEQRVPAEMENVRAEARKILKVLEDERTGVSGTASWSMGYGDAFAIYAATSARRT
ncbi:hypothetical protein CKM354_001119900 [Cercospora kikuchii]|uniref:Uncharacterized protein n=1 Tax=Cercospora kikuchii TaxID=84275 RepID=A0A9P3CT50_9PEZI|nr:uncharacterized protein CKM354_001119900 [Cercospora kikuchii]GIZ48126.1 hypothetical protein CKM354_001119900 [Cercospora kikuchii]